jgi:hypothetical protein
MQAICSQQGNLVKITTQWRYANMRHTKSRRKLIAATHNGKNKHLTLPMIKQLIFFSPYWWPTIDEDIKYHAEYECEKCEKCYNSIGSKKR